MRGGTVCSWWKTFKWEEGINWVFQICNLVRGTVKEYATSMIKRLKICDPFYMWKAVEIQSVFGFQLYYLVLLLNLRGLDLRGGCFLSNILLGCSIHCELESFWKYKLDSKWEKFSRKKKNHCRTNSNASFQTRT